jgi:Holliday junction resolvasome RuvABC endonuclease subunit
MTKIALDLGQHMGYCVFDGLKIIEYGTFNLPSVESKKEGRVLQRRYLSIKRFLEKHKDVDQVFYEMTDWHRSGYPAESFSKRQLREKQNRVVQRALGRIEMAIEAACTELSMSPVPVLVHDAKKVLTGNGNASKDQVAKQIKLLFPNVKADTEQDALDAISPMIWANLFYLLL